MKKEHEFLGLRIPQKTKQALEDNASKLGFVSISEYVRCILRQEVEREES